MKKMNLISLIPVYLSGSLAMVCVYRIFEPNITSILETWVFWGLILSSMLERYYKKKNKQKSSEDI